MLIRPWLRHSFHVLLTLIGLPTFFLPHVNIKETHMTEDSLICRHGWSCISWWSMNWEEATQAKKCSERELMYHVSGNKGVLKWGQFFFCPTFLWQAWGCLSSSWHSLSFLYPCISFHVHLSRSCFYYSRVNILYFVPSSLWFTLCFHCLFLSSTRISWR